MGAERRYLYEELERDLGGFPVDQFVRAYAKAYLEADLETLRKLNELLDGDISEPREPDPPRTIALARPSHQPKGHDRIRIPD